MTGKRFVYLLTNLANGKMYVGKAGDVAKRWAGHLHFARRDKPYSISRAIRKYGAGSFSVETIESCNSDRDALERETFWIRHYETHNPSVGYNMTLGGEGEMHTPDAKEKMRAAAKARVAEDATYIERMWRRSVAVRTGVARDSETRAKIASSLTGLRTGTKMSAEAKTRMSESAKRRWAGITQRNCTRPDCTKRAVARGLCNTHYARHWRAARKAG